MVKGGFVPLTHHKKRKGGIIMYYAGIGSRETPGLMLGAFARIGEFLAKKGYTLRSGGADGADTAFEVGCD